MGMAASQARYNALTARKSELELEGQFTNQARLNLANITGNLFNTATRLDPNSDQALRIQARINSIASLDKALELQLRNLDTQRQAISTELDAMAKVIGKNIDRNFKDLFA